MPKTLDDLADFMAGKILVALGFEHELYPAWTGQVCTRRRLDRRLQVARAHRGDVRRDRGALRPPQSSPERRHRSRGGGSARSGRCALTGRERVLDLCTGTGDLAIAARARAAGGGARRRRRLSPARCCASALDKLRRAAARPIAIALVRGDATRIPLADASVDAVTIGFGIRNVERHGRRRAPRCTAC